MKNDLTYYGGDGFGGCPEYANYTVKYDDIDLSFNNLVEARNFYNSLECEKSIWYNGELLECHTYGEDSETDDLPFG